ncbi:hypothetical protein AAVH_19349 [Aphelenchoides avenae]|nr:hypothetical protein AAVH_19349 [Aphelenchus avenae]
MYPGKSKLIPGGTKKANLKDAEEACLALHAEIPEEVRTVDDYVWLLNDDPRDKSDMTRSDYVHCYALNNKAGTVAELKCEEEHAVACEVSAEAGTCDKDGDVYYKDEKDDAYCYKASLVYEEIDKPKRIEEKDAVKACTDADAGKAASVHSPQENHLVALLYRAKYEADNRYNCLRLGVFFDESDGEISLRQVVDGSNFDFGAQPNGTLPKCGSTPGYPWCKGKEGGEWGEPNCQGVETSLMLWGGLYDTRYCWDDGLSWRSCSVACKKKLH